MKKHREMVGFKFGKLTVIEMFGERVTARHPNWRCECDCGNEKIMSEVQLLNGAMPSCGCEIRKAQRSRNDLTGKVFGRLTVLKSLEHSNVKRHIVWVCQCECGSLHNAASSDLRSGNVRSCGCLHSDTVKDRNTTHGHSTHGELTGTYVSWASMLTRCRNKNIRNFHHYGGRGITVCDRWLRFENFLEDMGERPKDMSIDRIDVNGNYEPSNCRWATFSQQIANRRKPNGK